MSRRRLTIEIDAEAATCGACPHVEHDRWGRERAACLLFDVRLLFADPLRRAPECLAAESAARPWEGSEDDDDPMPHHLQEKRS